MRLSERHTLQLESLAAWVGAEARTQRARGERDWRLVRVTRTEETDAVVMAAVLLDGCRRRLWTYTADLDYREINLVAGDAVVAGYVPQDRA